MSATIAALTALTALFLVVIYKLYEATKKKTSALQFAGRTAVAIDEISLKREGFVLFQGEHWKATSKNTISRGEKVTVVSRDGLTLIVEPIKEFI
jgi:membrane-bound ClpP family serine protease